MSSHLPDDYSARYLCAQNDVLTGRFDEEGWLAYTKDIRARKALNLETFHRKMAIKLMLPYTLTASDFTIPTFCPVFPKILLNPAGISRTDEAAPGLVRIYGGHSAYIPSNVLICSGRAIRGDKREIQVILGPEKYAQIARELSELKVAPGSRSSQQEVEEDKLAKAYKKLVPEWVGPVTLEMYEKASNNERINRAYHLLLWCHLSTERLNDVVFPVKCPVSDYFIDVLATAPAASAAWLLVVPNRKWLFVLARAAIKKVDLTKQDELYLTLCEKAGLEP